MASTYSPQLRLELIAAGEQGGLWGNTLNNTLGSLLEQAIAGVTFVVLPSTSADYSLTATNGAVDEARAAVLVFTGTPTGPLNIIVPASQKSWVFRNGTDQTLTLKTSSQVGGVALTSGNTVPVFCDGTAVYPSITAGVIGAPTTTGGGASGTWGINVTGSAGTAGYATTAGNADTVTNGVYLADLTTGSTASANKVPRFNSNGDLAVGGTLQGNYNGTDAINAVNPTFGMEFGRLGVLSSTNPTTGNEMGSSQIHLGYNLYYDSGWKFKSNGYGTRMVVSPQGFTFDGTGYGGTGQTPIFTQWAVINGGGITASGPYTNTSDRRVKADLVPVVAALEKVALLTGFTYRRTDWDGNQPREMGLIAQDVQAVAPEVVREGDDGFLGVQYGPLTALLVEAIKELRAEVHALKAAR